MIRYERILAEESPKLSYTNKKTNNDKNKDDNKISYTDKKNDDNTNDDTRISYTDKKNDDNTNDDTKIQKTISNITNHESTSDRYKSTIHIEQVQVHNTRSTTNKKRLDISNFEPKCRSMQDMNLNENDESEEDDDKLENEIRESYFSEWKLNLLYENHRKEETFDKAKEKLQEELKNSEKELKSLGLQINGDNGSKSLLKIGDKSTLNEELELDESYSEKLERDVCGYYGVSGEEFESFQREKQALKRVIWKVYCEKQTELVHCRALKK